VNFLEISLLRKLKVKLLAQPKRLNLPLMTIQTHMISERKTMIEHDKQVKSILGLIVSDVKKGYAVAREQVTA